MFSFFRRGKSKDEGDRKSKEKSSFSPFTKRSESSKKEVSPVTTNVNFVSDSSIPLPLEDVETGEHSQEHEVENLNSNTTLQTHSTTIDDRPQQNGVSSTYECSLVSSDDCLPLADQNQQVTTEEVFERAGSQNSDSGFKTAPNTPVLPKHLSVTEESLIDSPLGAQLDFPSADSDPEVEPAKEEVPEEREEEEDQCRDKSVVCLEEMSHGPGELYDIAEEETSEEDEEEEEDEQASEDDDDDSGNVTQPTIEEEYPDEIVKRNFVNQEAAQIQERVGDLTARLCARELESNKLLCQIDELQRQVMVKTGGMDRLQAELNSATKESEFVRRRLRKLEEDLDTVKHKNDELKEEIQNREDGFDFNRLLELEDQVKELTRRVKELEEQLEEARLEKERLEQEAKESAQERDEEKRIVQEAIDKALAEKLAIQTKFEKDFERLRTVNTDREQQLLDDFEWKLREVEQACKRRLDDKEKSARQRVKVAEDKLQAVQQDLSQLEGLRQFEAEATQLRGLNLEQQRALRIAERTKEELQVSEKVLKEELKKLKELLDKEKSALTTMQAIHNREIDEKDRKMKFRLEQQKTDLNNQWEEKLRKETLRLRIELDQINRDDKRLLLETARVEKEAELLKSKEKWDARLQESLKEIEALKQKIVDNEEQHQINVENIRTHADRDMFDLRRKLDKIDLSYEEKIEKIQRDHEKQKERLLEECEMKVLNCEQSFQNQLSSTRTTLELVKEQLKRESADQIQALHETHRCQLEEQWEQLMAEKDETVAEMEERHRASLEKMRTELETVYKCRNTREQELVEIVSKMRDELGGKTILVKDLSSQAESLQDNIEQLTEDISCHQQKLHLVQEESEKKLRLLDEEHSRETRQQEVSHRQEVETWRTANQQLQTRVTQLLTLLEESKDSKSVEELRRALMEKEQQVAQLSKEKHLYQLELMNRNCTAGNITARQRRKGGRGKPNKPGPSRK